MPCYLRLIVLASIGLPLCQQASAAPREGGLPESISRVERETGGRVLSAERREQGGREMNRIKVYMPEGRVRVMWDEPRAQPPRPQQPPRPPAGREPPPRGEQR